ncbi:hypothetical protein [Lacibacter sp.]|uniref:hypothetical protein n=1 Tax=Lacibacter sp. TaxID=1915409 RepID=UPI002B4B24CD|nr:hypothetical protein [Lacibacter sp.]HLP38864.1 hypothetical protein [Lacibacter sp.]
MKTIKTIALFLSLYFSSSAQTVLSNIPDSGKTIAAFIPKGYDTIGIAKGDLNKDNIDDIVLALKYKDEDTFEMDEEPKRILLVLLMSNKGLKVIGKSENVLMCRHCGGMYGDPFSAMDITKGVLSIHHYGGSSWRWSEVRKFRMNQNGMSLIGATSDLFWSMQACNGSEIGDAGRQFRDVNFVTCDEEIIERTVECKLIKQVKQKIKRRPLVKLEDFNFEEEY